MNLDTDDLEKLSEMCLDYYEDQHSNVLSIVLYGSGALNYLGGYDEPNDIDLNLFLSEDSGLNPTTTPVHIEEDYRGTGRVVEVMRTIIGDDSSIQEYVKRRLAETSEGRWHRITNAPFVQIYPKIEPETWE